VKEGEQKRLTQFAQVRKEEAGQQAEDAGKWAGEKGQQARQAVQK
jgi:hypothetical protein